MCGRFTLTVTPEMLAEQFNLDEVPTLPPRFNIAPSQAVAVVRLHHAGRRTLDVVQWGLIPVWAKDPKIGSKLINARAEEIETKPAFRGPIKYHRCLIVSDGFYEWKGKGKAKQPYYFRMKDDRPFGFAGIWDHWEGADGSYIESCALLTTEANTLTRAVHDRMPVIVKPADYDLWLDPAIKDVARLKPIFKPYPAKEMKAHPVSALVNSPFHEDPQCILPVTEVPSEKGRAGEQTELF